MTTTTAQASANAKNARKSTGPRSDEGKARSSKNALKHGLTSKDAVLPTEDPAAFHETLTHWLDYYQPQDPAQAAMIERAVVSKWKLDRCTRVETVRLSESIRHADLHYDLDRTCAAEELGRRLLDDPLNRCDVTAVNDSSIVFRMKERIADNPAILQRQLQMTSQGVHWLLKHWEELSASLERQGFWYPHEKYRVLWLLGKEFNDIIGDPLAQQLFLACRVARPDEGGNPVGSNVWDDCYQPKTIVGDTTRCIHDIETLREQSPADAREAYSILCEILSHEIRRLRALKTSILDPLDQIDRAAAQERATFDTSKEAGLLRRYESACEKEFHRSVSDLLRLRKQPLPETEEPPPQNEPIAEPPVEQDVTSDVTVVPRFAPYDPEPTPPVAELVTLWERTIGVESPPSTVL